MTVSILMITHQQVGNALINAVHSIFGRLPLPTRVIEVSYSAKPNDLIPKLSALISEVNPQQGILILTDMFGSTPCNIAASLQNYPFVKVIAGVNLPMLMRVMNYPELSLLQLADKAISGGKDGVCQCQVHERAS